MKFGVGNMTKADLDRIEDKVDKCTDAINQMAQHMAVYNAELNRHIEGVEQNRREIQQLEGRVEPIQAHVIKVQTVMAVFKWLGLGGTVAVIGGIAKFFGVF